MKPLKQASLPVLTAMTLTLLLSVCDSSCSASIATDPTEPVTPYGADELRVILNAQPCMPVDSLRGIDRLNVLVEDFPTELAGGLSSDAMQAVIEDKLRAKGFTVMSGPGRWPTYYVELSLLKVSRRVFYSLRSCLTESSLPVRNISAMVPMQSWFAEMIGSIKFRDKSKLGHLASKVMDQLDQFTSACKAASTP